MRRLARSVAALVVLICSLPFAAADHAGAAARRLSATAVQVRVLDVSPSAPALSTTPQPLTVQLQLTNTTGQVLRNVVVAGTRPDPLQTQTALDAVLSGKATVSGGKAIPPKHPARADLAPGVPTPVGFQTDTDRLDGQAGICQCANGVYPLLFTAQQDTPTGLRTLGTAVTFLPSFIQKPAPVRVSWIWPILDRPHRLGTELDRPLHPDSETVFTDDALTDSINPGGRLSQSLATVQAVDPKIPMTLVLDPDLLDELEVMAAGTYTVRSGTRQVPGTGRLAAQRWLDQLATLLQGRPTTLAVKLTPYADPDVQSLGAKHLAWQGRVPAAMLGRVTSALAGRSLDFDFSWPASGVLGSSALGGLVDDGVRTVLLNAAAVTPHDAPGAVPSAVGAVRKNGQTVAVALTSPSVQRLVSTIVTRDQAGLGQLPQLTAEIAIRAAQDRTAEHVLVLSPPRYVEPDPASAAAAINRTSNSPFAKAISLADATAADRLPAQRQRQHLAPVPASAPTLPAAVTDTASSVTPTSRTVFSLLGAGAAARTITDALASGLQRAESAYWLVDRRTGESAAAALRGRVDAFTSGVRIVRPASGSYTLGSANSPLPVTVSNDLGYAVSVRLRVTTVNDLPGFTARDIGAKTVQPHGRRTFQLPTTIARSGRILIQAQLMTPDGRALGNPIPLSVHSTVLGVLGVVITIVSGAVLVLALLIRVIRRVRARGGDGATAPDAAGVPAGTGGSAP